MNQLNLKLFLSCLALIMAIPVIAQKASFFSRQRVAINQYANKGFEVKLIDTKLHVKQEKTAKTFDAVNNLASYQLTEKPDWSKQVILDNNIAGLLTLLQNRVYLDADIKPEDGRLLVYFWPFPEDPNGTAAQQADIKTANDFFKDHTFAIELKERDNLALKSSAFHAGPMVLPLKIFLGGPDSVSSVTASANVGLYIGKRYGKTHYVKLPDEKEYTVYETSHSWNLILGLSKLDLDEKNTKDGGKNFKGSIAAFTTGIAYGLHIKNFTVFGGIGLDFPFGKKGKQWSLRNQPWIGFGAGFDIF